VKYTSYLYSMEKMNEEEFNELLECEGFIYFEGNKRVGRAYEQIDMSKYENIGELLGGLSMCWNPIPSGVFDSSSAELFADEIENRYNSVSHAISVLSKALKEDSYFIGWQSNIAMALYDELTQDHVLCCDRGSHRDKILQHCNQAAKNFLNLLIKV